MGDFQRAESLHLQSLRIRKEVLGLRHQNYAESLHNLADIYKELEKYELAEPLYLQASDVFANSVGKTHPDYAVSLHNLANLYRLMGDLDQARSLYIQAKDVLNKAVGTNHPDYATTVNNLAFVCYSMCEFEHAEKLYLEAGEIFQKTVGKQHWSFTNYLKNLAMLYVEKGERSKAESLLLEACNIKRDLAFQILPTLSESQSLFWITKNRPRTDLWLTILRDGKTKPSDSIYKQIWQTKALATRLRAGSTPKKDGSEKEKLLFAELRKARGKLAKLASAKPNPNQVTTYRKAIISASEEKETLEKKIARISIEAKREFESRDATIDEFLSRLPAGVVVIDFVSRK